MNAVWIVDDDQSIRWVLEKALTREGLAVRAFASAGECLRALDVEAPQVLVSDIRMPGASGIELLQRVRERKPDTPVIIMTAYSDLDSAVAAFQGGAFEYLPKPFDLTRAVELIRRAVDERAREVADDDSADVAVDMLGHAPAMQEVFRAIGRLSQSIATVLITGESGTGKELVARALHQHSPRAGAAFVALNTAAIPRELLESELFGHERGAFTGAQQLRRGRFEEAEGGTLFLDEIGDMPPELQTRLLRVLSDGQYYRVGGQRPLEARARVIAATHQDLEARVRQGLFREDLLHRLNVIRLRLPPLRERTEDIALLARHFLQRSARDLGVEAKRLSGGALQAMCRFAWPGNVRQLENVCNWLTVMAPAQTVDAKDLPPEMRALAAGEGSGAVAAWRADEARPVTASAAPDAAATPQSGSGSAPDADVSNWPDLLERAVAASLAAQPLASRQEGRSDLMDRLTREFEGAIIRAALRHTRGRRIDAALRLGIGRNTITRKIQELHLEEPRSGE
ncbi:MAG: nitrogen regulation protein NR(I) [Burkholderiaceae bacterium]|nr:nitrogen regulation protein NR(I) [Burkholderiaceae bacterium]